MKRTLRRELKAPEIVRREAFEVSGSPRNPLGSVWWFDDRGAAERGFRASPPFSGQRAIRFDEGFEAGRRRLDRREDDCKGGAADSRPWCFGPPTPLAVRAVDRAEESKPHGPALL
jgi:hypothetical protein